MAKKAKAPKAKVDKNGKEKKPNWFVRRWRSLKNWAHETKLELKKVHWPKRDELFKACASVLVCVLVVGVFVWVLDAVAAGVINALLHLFQG
ncbi:MAG: preprotein translocase subunit SecE [Clostridiales bacterium]|nr:preprotein translocase subunit SecE [Clostridiales bacterium]